MNMPAGDMVLELIGDPLACAHRDRREARDSLSRARVATRRAQEAQARLSTQLASCLEADERGRSREAERRAEWYAQGNQGEPPRLAPDPTELRERATLEHELRVAAATVTALESAQREREVEVLQAEQAVVAVVDRILAAEADAIAQEILDRLDEVASLARRLRAQRPDAMHVPVNLLPTVSSVPPGSETVQRALDIAALLAERDRINTPVSVLGGRSDDIAAERDAVVARRIALIDGTQSPQEATP